MQFHPGHMRCEQVTVVCEVRLTINAIKQRKDSDAFQLLCKNRASPKQDQERPGHRLRKIQTNHIVSPDAGSCQGPATFRLLLRLPLLLRKYCQRTAS